MCHAACEPVKGCVVWATQSLHRVRKRVALVKPTAGTVFGAPAKLLLTRNGGITLSTPTPDEASSALLSLSPRRYS